jgi:hypothetical protein
MAENSQQAFQDIQNFDASRANPTDVLSQAEGKYNVGQSRQRLVGLRSAIMGTEGALNAVDPSVTGRTSNSLVTEAQRSRMVANERAPIAEQYSQQQGALGNENSNYSDLQSQASKEAQMRLTGDDVKRSSLQSLYDSLYKREQDAIAKQQAEQARQDALNAAAEARKSQLDYQKFMSQLQANQNNRDKVPATPSGGGGNRKPIESYQEPAVYTAKVTPSDFAKEYGTNLLKALQYGTIPGLTYTAAKAGYNGIKSLARKLF